MEILNPSKYQRILNCHNFCIPSNFPQNSQSPKILSINKNSSSRPNHNKTCNTWSTKGSIKAFFLCIASWVQGCLSWVPYRFVRQYLLATKPYTFFFFGVCQCKHISRIVKVLWHARVTSQLTLLLPARRELR